MRWIPLAVWDRTTCAGAGQGRPYACHGDPLPPSEPGAPITEADDDDHVYIAPTATVERAWLESGFIGAPVFLPEEELAAPRLVVPDVVTRMVRPTDLTSPGLAALGAQRFAILDSLGLTDPDRLARRLAELSDSDTSDLRFFFLDMARSTLECLSAEDQALARKLSSGLGMPIPPRWSAPRCSGPTTTS